MAPSESTPDTPERSTLDRWLHEPTLHFLLLAVALFAASTLLGAGDQKVLEIRRGEIEARLLQVELQQGRPLSPEERRQVEEAYVEERVLVREAREMGLDRDPGIDDLLVQKMLHVLSGDVIQPTEQELQDFFEANRDRYVSPPTVTVDELVIPASEPVPDGLEERLGAGTLPAELGRDTRRYPRMRRADLDRLLGPETAGRVFTAETGRWVGPHTTVRGDHWLRVVERTGTVAPTLELAREEVRLDWIAQEEEARLKARVAELRREYAVEVLGGEGPP